jgi:hypothetical protein
MSDPNWNLARQRAIAEEALESEIIDPDDLLRLAELVVDLDEEIASGGPLPKRWARPRNAPRARAAPPRRRRQATPTLREGQTVEHTRTGGRYLVASVSTEFPDDPWAKLRRLSGEDLARPWVPAGELRVLSADEIAAPRRPRNFSFSDITGLLGKLTGGSDDKKTTPAASPPAMAPSAPPPPPARPAASPPYAPPRMAPPPAAPAPLAPVPPPPVPEARIYFWPPR